MQTMTKIKCSQCGVDAEVPFTPTPGRKVYCRQCWGAIKDKRKQEAAARLAKTAGKQFKPTGSSIVWSREAQGET